jgi:hypothetical protein
MILDTTETLAPAAAALKVAAPDVKAMSELPDEAAATCALADEITCRLTLSLLRLKIP